MKWNAWCATVLALLLLLGGRVDAREAPERLNLWLVAEVEIDTDGRVKSLGWKDKRPVAKFVIERIEPRIRQWRFEPGAIDGVPQVTQTHLTVQVVGEAVGDGLALRFGKANTGAKYKHLAVPRYPQQAAMANEGASLVATANVDVDGRVVSHTVEYTSGNDKYRSQFIKAVEAAIADSRFTPERVGGRPLATQVSIPYDFCMGRGCENREKARAATLEQHGPSGEPIALDSAVRLLTAVEGEAI